MFELAVAFIALFSAIIFLAHVIEAIGLNKKRGTKPRGSSLNSYHRLIFLECEP
jgi:hypothetical protein